MMMIAKMMQKKKKKKSPKVKKVTFINPEDLDGDDLIFYQKSY